MAFERSKTSSPGSSGVRHDGGVDLAHEQRLVLRNSAFSALFCALVITAACLVMPRLFTPPGSLIERVAFTLQSDVFVLVWLVVGAKLVSSGRYRSAADNRGSAYAPPSPRIAIKVAFLQNTLEQAVMAVGAHLAFATLATGPSLFLIPASVALFGIGRLTFLLGYPHGAGGRSFGMATTAIPTVVAYVWTIALLGRGMWA